MHSKARDGRFLLMALGLALAALSSPLQAAEVKLPTLDWGACPPAEKGQASTESFQCADAVVPMDYAAPEKGSFTLALIRHPAAKPEQRIGTLMWNPGGPSDAGTVYLPAGLKGFPEAVRQRFDILSWDPRGMGGRTRPVVQCFDSAAAEAQFMAGLGNGIATTPEQLAAEGARRAALNAACVKTSGELLPHVSTADNARDMDLIRRALGEERISYYGTSYGTFLGATYINMFPERVRAAVLDGGVAPSAWAGNDGEDLSLSTFIRLGSDLGSAMTVDAFIAACGEAAVTDCPFSAGTAQATREKWSELLARATRTGIDYEGEHADQGAILAYVQSTLYLVDPLPGFDRFPGYRAVAQLLQALWEASEGKAPRPDESDDEAEAAKTSGAAAPEVYVTSAGRQLAVVCGESPNPASVEAMSRQAEASFARAGLSSWALTAFCVNWTARASAPYLGPWNRMTDAPVLVIASSYDPATAFGSSVRLAQELGKARLLPVNGFGHTVLFNPDRCAQDHVTAYLTTLALPPTGAACRDDKPPFGGG